MFYSSPLGIVLPKAQLNVHFVGEEKLFETVRQAKYV